MPNQMPTVSAAHIKNILNAFNPEEQEVLRNTLELDTALAGEDKKDQPIRKIILLGLVIGGNIALEIGRYINSQPISQWALATIMASPILYQLIKSDEDGMKKFLISVGAGLVTAGVVYLQRQIVMADFMQSTPTP
jgi:hypothetical protein